MVAVDDISKYCIVVRNYMVKCLVMTRKKVNIPLSWNKNIKKYEVNMLKHSAVLTNVYHLCNDDQSPWPYKHIVILC